MRETMLECVESAGKASASGRTKTRRLRVTSGGCGEHLLGRHFDMDPGYGLPLGRIVGWLTQLMPPKRMRIRSSLPPAWWGRFAGYTWRRVGRDWHPHTILRMTAAYPSRPAHHHRLAQDAFVANLARLITAPASQSAFNPACSAESW